MRHKILPGGGEDVLCPRTGLTWTRAGCMGSGRLDRGGLFIQRFFFSLFVQLPEKSVHRLRKTSTPCGVHESFS